MATTTLVGNLTADPELKTTNDGTEYARFSLAWNERQKAGDDWIDGPTTFIRCTVWGRLAKHTANNLSKGTRVLVTGDMRAEEWASDKGPQTDVTMNVKHLGVSLEFADVTITKREKSGGAGAFGQGSAHAQTATSGNTTTGTGNQQVNPSAQPTGWQVQDQQAGFSDGTPLPDEPQPAF